jgi:thymidine kinase
MAKLFFRYGAMNAGKSTQLLQAAHNYEERHQTCMVFKPATDNREGHDVIAPRIGGLKRVVDGLIQNDGDFLSILENRISAGYPRPNCILVDEAQFLTRSQVDELCRIVDDYNIPVLCYGLRADFRGELFPGSAALMALADSIEELKTICWCGKKATVNARLLNGNVQYDGPQVLIGGNETYTSLCRKHWRQNKPLPK